MTPRILVLEGPDGCGKSTHADRLAAALRAEGVDAVAFHHTKPADADPVLAALDYAAQRRRLVLTPPAAVIVADRWSQSTWCLGKATEGRSSLCSLAAAESDWVESVALRLLEAPDDVLDARLAARGTPATEADRRLRDAYRGWGEHFTGTVDTSRPADDVAAELLAWARGVLR